MKRLFFIFLLSFFIHSCGKGIEGELIDGVSSQDHRIFVTSLTYDGNLGGTSGADAKCSSVAQNASFKRTYKAIVSTSSESSSRFEFSGEIYTVDSSGESSLIAESGTKLFGTDSSELLDAVDIDENGSTIGSPVRVWTGTGSDGTAMSDTCSNWTTNSSGTDGFYGEATYSNTGWLESDFADCSNSYRIYCVSQ